jgi:hypothetical protein
MGRRKEGGRPPDLIALKEEAKNLAGEALACNTSNQYWYKGVAFIKFALRYIRAAGIKGHPPDLIFKRAIALRILPLYVAHLARTCVFKSAKIHLSAIRHLFVSRDLENPIPFSQKVKLCMKGLRRKKGDGAPNRKLGITIEMLNLMASMTDKNDPEAVAFMAAALVAFFTCARKANVSVESGVSWDPDKILRRRDIKVDSDSHSLMVTFRHTKTIQFKERTLDIPICGVKGSAIDPVWWWCRHLYHLGAGAMKDDQAFSFRARNASGLSQMTHRRFVDRLKSVLQAAGVDPAKFSGHSFRRGGATFLFNATGNTKIVQAIGDWKSCAYDVYLTIGLADRWNGAELMRKRLRDMYSLG